MLLTTAVALFPGCGSASRGERIDRARSQIAASAYLLEQFAAGDGTEIFTSASVREYRDALAASESSLTPPASEAEKPTVEAIADAHEALAQAGSIRRADAAPLAARL